MYIIIKNVIESGNFELKDSKRYICIAPEGYGVSYGPDILPGMWQAME